VKIGRDPAFARAYAAQTHVTADGNPIVWLCAMAGQEVELIPGSELVDPVAGLAAEAGVPVALFGSTDAALAAAGAALVARHPNLRIAARIAPPMGFDPQGAAAEAAIAELGASGAGLCFLALGAPQAGGLRGPGPGRAARDGVPVDRRGARFPGRVSDPRPEDRAQTGA
jgi:N-acetylglucosaminyldiphosphoundecaprenol N-acetyl-beta-D-mannosaminyltransferase